MHRSFLQLLRCPYCGGEFKSSENEQLSGNSGYSILTCHCSRYPVVAGIPVLLKDKTTDKVIALIESGQRLEALLTLIQPANLSISSVWKLSALMPHKISDWVRYMTHQRSLRKWKEQAAVLLTDHSGQVKACDILQVINKIRMRDNLSKKWIPKTY